MNRTKGVLVDLNQQTQRTFNPIIGSRRSSRYFLDTKQKENKNLNKQEFYVPWVHPDDEKTNEYGGQNSESIFI